MTDPPPIQIRFPRTRSPHFGHVLALAKLAPYFEVDDPDDPHLITAGYTDAPAHVAQAVDLWSRIYGWTQAVLWVRGAPVMHRDRWRILEVLGCACTAARSPDRLDYCEARADLPWQTPPIPCRLLLMTWGREIERLPWREDAQGAMRAVWAKVLERGLDLCPFFPLPAIRQAAGIREPSTLPERPDLEGLVREIEAEGRRPEE